jgi:hypothetical protein
MGEVTQADVEYDIYALINSDPSELDEPQLEKVITFIRRQRIEFDAAEAEGKKPKPRAQKASLPKADLSNLSADDLLARL